MKKLINLAKKSLKISIVFLATIIFTPLALLLDILYIIFNSLALLLDWARNFILYLFELLCLYID